MNKTVEVDVIDLALLQSKYLRSVIEENSLLYKLNISFSSRVNFCFIFKRYPVGASMETRDRLIYGEFQQPRLPIFGVLYPTTLVLFRHFHLDFDWDFLTLSFPCSMLCSCGCLETAFSASLEWGSSFSCGSLVRRVQEPMKSEWCVGFDPIPTHSCCDVTAESWAGSDS